MMKWYIWKRTMRKIYDDENNLEDKNNIHESETHDNGDNIEY